MEKISSDILLFKSCFNHSYIVYFEENVSDLPTIIVEFELLGSKT